MTDDPPTATSRTFGQVVVASGHLIDGPDRPRERFPEAAEPEVTAAVGRVFRQWGLGPDDLVITGGARGGDIIAAEQALHLGAEVWLLVALPDAPFVDASVRLAGTDWEARYHALRSACRTTFQPPVPDRAGDEEPDTSRNEDAFVRNNSWMLEVATGVERRGSLRVLAVWDGHEAEGPGGTADLVSLARDLGATVEVIDPRPS